MVEFLVLYEEPHFVAAGTTNDTQSPYETKGHALIVAAHTEQHAFVVAFDYLTRRGHMVRTMKAGETLENLQQSQQERRAYDKTVTILVTAGLSLDDMQAIYHAGVPIIGGKGDRRTMTNIVRIQPYGVQCEGHVVAVQSKPD